MLIVVVIIGILSAALLPKLTWYMARTRDLKRQVDLRNIAAVIEMYKNEHGELPLECWGHIEANKPGGCSLGRSFFR